MNKKCREGFLLFICSVRASTLKFFSLIALCLAGLAVAIALGSSADVSAAADGGIRFDGIEDDEQRRAFVTAQGYNLADGIVEQVTFSVPKDFDRVISGYNEIQKKQGLDLTRYKGKKVTRYTYKVENYGGYDGTVYANLIVYRSKIIACDVSSADPSGFVKPLVAIA